MNVYMAGGVNGNLNSYWRRVAVSGQRSAVTCPIPDINEQMILESFYYAKDNRYIPSLVPHFKSFLLDSGAFTFMQKSKVGIDWNRYVDEYSDFIKANNIDLFLELDIDSIVGIDEVESLRKRIEQRTGKQPIPVWHKSRGKEYFIEMCKDYKYVAIGGIVTREIKRELYERMFPWFISIAHDNECKIHGLGYSSIEGCKKYHFDSVDSTSWLSGNRGGFLYRFNSKNCTMDKIDAPEGKRLKPKESAMWNFLEWNKFQKYAKKYL